MVWLWWCGIRMQVEALVLKEIIKQVTSSWSLFTQICLCLLSRVARCSALNGQDMQNPTQTLTYIMQQIHGEANSFLASQEILRILWNTGIHCHVSYSRPPARTLSQTNPFQACPLYSLTSILKLSSHLLLDLPSDLFPATPCLRFPSLLSLSHASLVSSYLI